MSVKIDIPDSPEPITEVTLSGKKYLFHFRFSTVENTYYFDISYQGEKIIRGLRVTEGTLSTGKYDIPDFNGGVLGVFKLKETDEPPNRNNVGIGKVYELVYIPFN